jgi:dTDP-4-amino-4,6-dideoxygalactose transaminase
MKVPALDLKPQIQADRAALMEAMESVVDTAGFVLGPLVEELEDSIASYVGTRHGIGVASGSDALLIALMALDIGEGDAVITTPYTFFATAGAIHRVGATPIFIDIRPDSFNIDEKLLAEYLEERCTVDTARGLSRDISTGKLVRAIIPVHLFGQCAEMGPITALAKKHNLPVIEDAAQALGATCDGAMAGSMGDIACLSFYPTKNLGGFGDGGMITTSDDKLAERCRSIRVHGGERQYYHATVGINSRLDALQAAVLLVGMRRLEEWISMRSEHARAYSLELAGVKGIVPPPTLEAKRHTFNQYVIRSTRRDELRACLAEQEIGSAIYYPLPLHLQECFSPLGYKDGDFPESERAAAESLAIPMFPYLTQEQRMIVTDAIKKFHEN